MKSFVGIKKRLGDPTLLRIGERDLLDQGISKIPKIDPKVL